VAATTSSRTPTCESYSTPRRGGQAKPSSAVSELLAINHSPLRRSDRGHAKCRVFDVDIRYQNAMVRGRVRVTKYGNSSGSSSDTVCNFKDHE
jgi:hypothetical protein